MRGRQDHTRQQGLRRDQTNAELTLWQHLRGRRLHGWKFRRQHRIGPYVTDFACLQGYVIVELDGSQHARQWKYDAARTRFLEQQGFCVLRYWNDAVYLQLSEVLDQIVTALEERCPSSALRAPSPHCHGEKDITDCITSLLPIAMGEKDIAGCPAVPTPRLRGEGAEGG